MQREPQTKTTAPHMSISYAYAYLCIYIFSNWGIHLSGNAQRIIFFFRYNYHILKANILNNYYGMSQSYTLLSLNINIVSKHKHNKAVTRVDKKGQRYIPDMTFENNLNI